MLRAIKNLMGGLLLTVAVQSASAFALLGPFDTSYQSSALGYQGLILNTQAPIGGPMNLGEEYRWNVPEITYAFDQSFLNYFGLKGVEAVEKALKIFNDLPNVDTITNGPAGDPNLYYPGGTPVPITTKLVNYQAQTLGLIDLKTTTMSLLTQQLGLAEAERWVWCLHNRQIAPGGSPTNYLVIKRNFDPVTYNYSSFVNDVLYSYSIVDQVLTGVSDAIETRFSDPFSTGGYTSVSGGVFSFGDFFTGLTRDDVGGLRYMLRFSNVNVENLMTPGTYTAFTGPWGIIGTTNNSNIVFTALRPGVQKVQFRKLSFDSLLGITFQPVTNRYNDSFFTNTLTGLRAKSQLLQRVDRAPMLVFAAADLGSTIGFVGSVATASTTTAAWVNNSALTPFIIGGAAGPGVIQPAPVVLTYTKIGPALINIAPNFVTEGTATKDFIWGSWDSVADTPVLYPDGTSLQQLEQLIIGGH